jgi:Tfp pilus assembly protein FimT
MQGDSPRRSDTSRVHQGRAGYTVIEALVVAGLIGVLAAVGAMVMPTALKAAKADGGLGQVSNILRVAREQAISQRRNMIVAFNTPNQIVVSRVEVPGPGTTVLDMIYLENAVTFKLFNNLPDTPDAFGNVSATYFGTATSLQFSSLGTFMDQNGFPLNGSVFVGRGTDTLSARAVTIFGPTALIREWRWNGLQWVN